MRTKTRLVAIHDLFNHRIARRYASVDGVARGYVMNRGGTQWIQVFNLAKLGVNIQGCLWVNRSHTMRQKCESRENAVCHFFHKSKIRVDLFKKS